MEFTNEEKERINQLYGNDFKDIKPEDGLLIARWEQHNAEVQAKYSAEMKALQDVADEKVRQSRETAELARANLKEMHDAAMARYARFEDGK